MFCIHMDRRPIWAGLAVALLTVLVLGALTAAPAAGQSDQFEPNDHRQEAPVLEPGTYTGLEMAGDEWFDYYAIEASAGEEVSGEITVQSGDGDLSLLMYGPDGGLQDDDYTSSGTATVQLTAQSDERYYVGVWGWQSNGTTYDLDLSTDSDSQASDRFEPNDREATATNAGPGTYDNLQIARDDTDVFAVDLGAGERIDANISYDGTGTLDLAIHSDTYSGAAIGYSDPPDEHASVTAHENETHYVEVESRWGAPIDYSLEIETSDAAGPIEDELDPNSFSNPTPVAPGTYQNLVNVGVEREYYAITLEAGQTLRTGLDFDHDVGDLDLRVTQENGDAEAESFTDTDGENATITAPETDIYRVKVIGWGGHVTPYDMTFEVDGQPAGDQFEENDRAATAAQPGTGRYTNLSVQEFDPDYYAVDLQAGEQLALSTTFDDTTPDARLSVTTPDGTELTDAGGDWLDTEFVADRNGTAVVHVESDSTDPREYNLQYNTGQPDATEPNREDHLAAPIGDGVVTGNLIGIADRDRYRLDLDEGDQATIIGTSDGGRTLGGGLSGPDGWTRGNRTADGYRLTYTAPTDGSYYLSTYAAGERDYEIVVNVTSSVSQTPSTTEVTRDDQTIRAGEPLVANVSVEPGQLVGAGLNYDSFDPDAALELHLPDGSVHTPESTGRWAITEAVTQQGGVATLRATSESETEITADLYLQAGAADPGEPNGAPGTATAVQPGTYEDRAILGTADIDRYSLDLSADETFTATVSDLPSDSDATMWIYGPDEEFVSWGWANDGEAEATVEAEQDGAYQIYFYGGVEESFDYDLSLTKGT